MPDQNGLFDFNFGQTWLAGEKSKVLEKSGNTEAEKLVLNRREAAQLAGISVSTLDRFLDPEAHGEHYAPFRFPVPISIGPGRIGWRRTDVEQWIKQRPPAPNGAPRKPRRRPLATPAVA